MDEKLLSELRDSLGAVGHPRWKDSAVVEISSVNLRDLLEIAEHAKILREALDDARQELEAQATYFGSHLSPENNLFRILRKLESALEATKPEE